MAKASGGASVPVRADAVASAPRALTVTPPQVRERFFPPMWAFAPPMAAWLIAAVVAHFVVTFQAIAKTCFVSERFADLLLENVILDRE